MTTKVLRASLVFGLTGLLMLPVCGGCCDCGHSENSIKYSPIYGSALFGGVVGLIIGHQSNEDGEGAALGAAVFATGCLLSQIDQLKPEKEKEEEDCCINVTGRDGSVVQVMLKKKDGLYVCPNGERYKDLPSREELIAVLGL
jgi:hypothetical protein